MNPQSPSNYLKALFESQPVAVLVADNDGRYLDANAAACALLHRSREEIVGRTMTQVIDPKRGPELELQFQSFLRDGVQSGFIPVRMPDGSEQELRFQAFANFVPGLHCAFLSQKRGAGTRTEDDSDALTMCAWTRRVLYHGEWISFEDYLLAAHGQRVTHGISPDAFAAVGLTE